MTEHELQNTIRLAIAPHAIALRINSGKFWSGTRVWDPVRQQYILTNIRPVHGAPEGTSDLIGCRRRDGKFVAIEVKTPTGTPTTAQLGFLQAVKESRGISGIARSAEDAIKILEE